MRTRLLEFWLSGTQNMAIFRRMLIGNRARPGGFLLKKTFFRPLCPARRAPIAWLFQHSESFFFGSRHGWHPLHATRIARCKSASIEANIEKRLNSTKFSIKNQQMLLLVNLPLTTILILLLKKIPALDWPLMEMQTVSV